MTAPRGSQLEVSGRQSTVGFNEQVVALTAFVGTWSTKSLDKMT